MTFGSTAFAELSFGEETIAFLVIVPSAQLTITPTAPSKAIDRQLQPGSEDLKISTTPPFKAFGMGYSPGAANLNISTTAPAVQLTLVYAVPALSLEISTTAASRVRTTNPAPGETPWRDEDAVEDDWVEEQEAA